MPSFEYESDGDDPVLLKPSFTRPAKRQKFSPQATRNSTCSSRARLSEVVEDSDEDVPITYVQASKGDYETGRRREQLLSSSPLSPLRPSFMSISPDSASQLESASEPHYASSCHTQRPDTCVELPGANDLTIVEVVDCLNCSETSLGPNPLGDQDVPSHGRSFRKRNAKQVHPYRYENKLYVQQMQRGGQADAIVKLRDIKHVSSQEDEEQEFQETHLRLESPLSEDDNRWSLSPHGRRTYHRRSLQRQSVYPSARLGRRPRPSGGNRLFLRPSRVAQSSLRRGTPEECGSICTRSPMSRLFSPISDTSPSPVSPSMSNQIILPSHLSPTPRHHAIGLKRAGRISNSRRRQNAPVPVLSDSADSCDVHRGVALVRRRRTSRHDTLVLLGDASSNAGGTLSSPLAQNEKSDSGGNARTSPTVEERARTALHIRNRGPAMEDMPWGASQVPKLTPSTHKIELPYLLDTRLVQLVRFVKSFRSLSSAPDNPLVYNVFGEWYSHNGSLEEFKGLAPKIVHGFRCWCEGRIHYDDGRRVAIDFILRYSQAASHHTFMLNDNPEEQITLIQALDDLLETNWTDISVWRQENQTRDEELGFRSLWLCWLAVEMSMRIACSRRVGADGYVFSLVHRHLRNLVSALLDAGLGTITRMLKSTTQQLSVIRDTGVELWVCVIHVSTLVNWTASPSALWGQIVSLLKEKFPRDSTRRGEEIWNAIFLLSALSQIEVTGTIIDEPIMKNSWEIVAEACGWLGTIHHSDGPNGSFIDRKSRSLLRRCVVLVSRWGWDLRFSVPALGMLQKIFLQRNYANLSDEEPNFPLFIVDFIFLPREIKYDTDDKAFDIYLRLVIWTALAMRKDLPQEAANKQIRKLTSGFPRGTVQFHKGDAPTNQELSQLYNRLTSTIVAFALEPTPYALRSRIQQAQQFTDFQIAGFQSRRAVIRAMMYISISSLKHSMGCSEGLEWFSSITCSLLNEYRELRDPSRIKKLDTVLSKARSQNINLLRTAFRTMVTVLGHLRWGGSDTVDAYPDPGFLSAPSLAQILRFFRDDNDAAMELGPDVGHYIRTFFRARARVFPPPRLIPMPSEESQEGLFDSLDPELLETEEFNAAINGGVLSPGPYADQDRKLAEIMQKDLVQNIYHILKHANAEMYDVDFLNIWVDCWVGCAVVLVKNKLRKWHDYIPQYAPDSWRRFGDPAVSRYVGMRFLNGVLELNPKIYESFKEEFVEIWFECLPSFHITMQPLFTANLFAIGGHQHFLLKDIRDEYDDIVKMSSSDFMGRRLTWITTAIGSLRSSQDNETTSATIVRNETARGQLRCMLRVMQDEHKEHASEGIMTELYCQFCLAVARSLKDSNVLRDDTQKDLLWTADLPSSEGK